jgi:hypothetical protein
LNLAFSTSVKTVKATSDPQKRTSLYAPNVVLKESKQAIDGMIGYPYHNSYILEILREKDLKII